MGFKFRRPFKIAPGVRLNVGKKGISSVSIGGKGARTNIGKRGTKTTLFGGLIKGASYQTGGRRKKAAGCAGTLMIGIACLSAVAAVALLA